MLRSDTMPEHAHYQVFTKRDLLQRVTAPCVTHTNSHPSAKLYSFSLLNLHSYLITWRVAQPDNYAQPHAKLHPQANTSSLCYPPL